jgi:hypothetical protein
MFRDLTGRRFGRLTVEKIDDGEARPHKWKCRCDCGQTKVVRGASLVSGNTKSCGCLSREVTSARRRGHGHTGNNRSLTYGCWQGMHNRCRKENPPPSANGGGQGLTVCDRWQTFELFLADMGERPSPSHALERVESDVGYQPDNVIWVTGDVQRTNQRKNVHLMLHGVTFHVSEWARQTGLEPDTIRTRLNRGWSVERALTEKPRWSRRPARTRRKELSCGGSER